MKNPTGIPGRSFGLLDGIGPKRYSKKYAIKSDQARNNIPKGWRKSLATSLDRNKRTGKRKPSMPKFNLDEFE